MSAVGGTIGSAFVRVRADVSGFAGEAKAAIGKVGPPIEAAADKALAFSKVAGTALVGIAGFGLKSAASLEQTRTAFTSLLGSSKAANDQLAALQKFAASTPFEQQDVFNYAQQFFAMSQSIGMAKGQVIPFLTAVGNIGAVTGASSQNIQSAITAIAQMGSAGKITSGDIRQLSDNLPGFNGVAAIAAATGKTSAQVMDEISSGSLDAKTGVAALVKGMQQFPGAAGAMQKQSQTLNGLWSTFTDNIKINLTNSLTQSIPIVKQALGQITGIVGTATKQLAPVLAQLIGALAPALGPLIAAISQLLTRFGTVIAPVLKAIVPLIKPIASAISDLIDAASPVLDVLVDLAKTIIPPLSKVVSVLAGFIGEFADILGKALQPVLPVIAKAIGQVAQVLQQLMPSITPLIQVLAGTFAQILGQLVQLFAQLFVALQPVITAFAGAFVTVLQAIGPQLPQIANSLGQLALSLAKILVAITPVLPLLAGLEAFFYKVGGGIIVALSKALTGVANVIAGVLAPTVRVIAGLFTNFSGTARAVWSAISGAVTSAVHAVSGAITSATNTIRNTWNNTWHAVTTAATTAASSVWNAISGLPGKIAGLAGSMFNAGAKLMGKLWDGIKSLGSKAIDFAAQVIGDIGSGIKNALNDILHLPWKLPRIKIGAFGHYVHVGGQTLFPRLAEGGMTLGEGIFTLGDNPSGREVALPLDSPQTIAALSDALDQALARRGFPAFTPPPVPSRGDTYQQVTINQVDDPIGTAMAVTRRLQALVA